MVTQVPLPLLPHDARDLGWRVSKNSVAALMAEMGPGRPAEEAPQGYHPARERPVEGAGPGQAGLPGGRHQP